MLTPHEKNNLIASLERAIVEAEKLPTTTSCLDCENFDGGTCKKWGEAIPEETIEAGCDEWVFSPSSPPF